MSSLGIIASSHPRATAWSPLDLPNLVRWLDAEDSTFDFGSGVEVSRWYDLSGNGWDMQQTTAANRPSRLASTLNGLAVVDFVTDDRLTPVSWTNRAQPCTVSMVFQVDLASSYQSVHQGAFTGFSYARDQFNASEAWGGSSGLAFGTVATATPYVLTVVMDGASSSVRLNGTSVATGTINGEGVENHAFGGATWSTTERSLDGFIAAHVVCSSALGTADLDLLDDYMIARWDL